MDLLSSKLLIRKFVDINFCATTFTITLMQRTDIMSGKEKLIIM